MSASGHQKLCAAQCGPSGGAQKRRILRQTLYSTCLSEIVLLASCIVEYLVCAGVELLSSGADIEKFGRSSGAEWLTLHAGADTVRTGAGKEINELSLDGVK